MHLEGNGLIGGKGYHPGGAVWAAVGILLLSCQAVGHKQGAEPVRAAGCPIKWFVCS